MNQDTIFLNGEGDAWFNRNKDRLKKSETKNPIFGQLLDLKISPTRILDVGCAGGDMLEQLRNQLGCECYGVDPSLDAIKNGTKRYSKISLSRGTAADMKFSIHFFDMITARFVFHWIDRNTLLESCAKIDTYLKWGGHLVINDFYSDGFIKQKYHHLPKEDVFTYKQYYPNIFLSTGNYDLISNAVFEYDNTDKQFLTILKKKHNVLLG